MSETNDPDQGHLPYQQNSQQPPESNYLAPEPLTIPLTSPQGANQPQQGNDIPASTSLLGTGSPLAGGYSPPSPGQNPPPQEGDPPAAEYNQYPSGHYSPVFSPALPGYAPPTGSKSDLSSMSMFEQLIADAKLVILHPTIASFDAIQSHASMGAVLLSLVTTGAAYGIGTLLFAPGAGLFAGLIGTFLGFFLSTALAFVAAKALSGVGDFKTYAYALAIFDLPLGVADGLCSAIPLLGTLTFLLSLFYGSYLTYLANRSVHRLSVGKSIVVGIVPLVTFAFLAMCAVAAVVALILPGMLSGGKP